MSEPRSCPVCGEDLTTEAGVRRCFAAHPLVPGETDEDRARRAGSKEARDAFARSS